MDWAGVTVRIDWQRSLRRRWPPTRTLHFTPQERRKRRNVLLYWWAGRGQRRLPSGLTTLRPGICHWARPGWSYECAQSPRNPLGVTAIHFDLLAAGGAVMPPDATRLPPEQLTVQSPRLVEEVTRWIAERALETRAGMALAEPLAAAGNSLLRGLLIKLVHDTSPAGTAPAGAAARGIGWRQLTAYIHQHLHELEGVEQLAANAGYTRSHFSRLFQAQTGLSPQEYIIRARLALAKELLRGTSLTISEIATRSGYGDLFQFSRQFKQRAGISPSQYRARAVAAGD